MERQWHEVLIRDDDGDAGFTAAAPLLVEALQLIESLQAIPSAVRLAHRLNELASDDATASPLSIKQAMEELNGPREMLRPFLDAIMTSFAPLAYYPLSAAPSAATTTNRAASSDTFLIRVGDDVQRAPVSSLQTLRGGRWGSADGEGQTTHHDSRRRQQQQQQRVIVRHRDGLVAPRDLQLQELLQSQALVSYNSFRGHFERLSAIAANGVLFTGCEPRLKVLQSRHALYRAYNGAREDRYHPTLGGGDVKRAPKTDIRRVETCMCSTSLMEFMERMRLCEPGYVVSSSEGTASRTPTSAVAVDSTPRSSDTVGKERESAEETYTHTSGETETITVKDVIQRFFGADTSDTTAFTTARESGTGVPSDAFKLTAEGLSLRPSYAEEGGTCLDTEDLVSAPCTRAENASTLLPGGSVGSGSGGGGGGDGYSQPQHHREHAAELLRHFVSLRSEDNGVLLARLIAPIVSSLTAAGTSSDRLELELTVRGSDRQEVSRLARWCEASGLLHDPCVQFCLRVVPLVGCACGGTTNAVDNSDGGNNGAMLNGGSPAAATSVSDDDDMAYPPPVWSANSAYGAAMLRAARQNQLTTLPTDSMASTASGNDIGVYKREQPLPTARHYGDVLSNVFGPLWQALLDPQSVPEIAALLPRLACVSVCTEDDASVGELPELPPTVDPSLHSLTGWSGPPSAFLAYHIWRNTQLLNCMTCAHVFFHTSRQTQRAREDVAAATSSESKTVPLRGEKEGSVETGLTATTEQTSWAAWNSLEDGEDGGALFQYLLPANSVYFHHKPLLTHPLRFRLHGAAESRGVFAEGLLGLLLADAVVNPSNVFDWPPLTYLYYLTQRFIVLTPSRNLSNRSTVKETLRRAIGLGVETGLNLSVATGDPLFHHATNDAMTEELQDMMKHDGLCPADVTEMSLRSMESTALLPFAERRRLFGCAWPHASDRFNDFTVTQVNSLRLRQRTQCLTHEMDLVCRRGLKDHPIGTLLSVPLSLLSALHPSSSYSESASSPSRSPFSLATTRPSPTLSATTAAAVTTAAASTATAKGDLFTFNASLSSGPALSARVQRRRLWWSMQVPLPLHRRGAWSGPSVHPQGSSPEQKRESYVAAVDAKLQKEEVPGIQHHFQEKTLLFPRIVIAGPNLAAPTRVGKTVSKMMVRRQEYQQFAVRQEHPATSLVAGVGRATGAPDALPYATAARVRQELPSSPAPSMTPTAATASRGTSSPRSPLRDTLHVPDKYMMRNGVMDVVLDDGSAAALSQSPPVGPHHHHHHQQQQTSAVTAAYFKPLPSWMAYQQDARALRALASDDDLQHFAKRRLGMLECKYLLHVALTNDDQEGFTVLLPPSAASSEENDRVSGDGRAQNSGSSSSSPIRDSGDTTVRQYEPLEGRRVRVRMDRRARGDVYNCVKVDVHCHMAGGVTAKSLLAFMKRKVHTNPDDVVGVDRATGTPITVFAFFQDILAKQQWQMRQHGHSLHDSQRLRLLSSAAAHVSPTATAAGATAAVAGGRRSGGTPSTMVFPTSIALRGPPSAVSAPSPDLSSRVLGVDDLTVAALEVQAGKDTFHRFDQFNGRYSPMGVSALRSLFLKTDNFMGGRYFAELIRDVFDKQAAEGYTFSEFRLSIYGRNRDEWCRLANWFVLHGMSHHTNRWMIQVPRLFALYRRSGMLHSFEEMLRNIFDPLWEASMHPEQHPFLNYFLAHVSGFDSVDNESDREPDAVVRLTPAQWTQPVNPPFAYYMYYMWANITTLNRYRAARGLSTFDFRPHGGESGDPDHMADLFFLVDGVGHGINLARRPALQYLYYLAQIPLGIVPLSNNALFCKYADNPFPTFFRRGLNVALATDGALMFHHTEQPLIEEYSTARNFWAFSSADVCEIAKNSVCMSGFPRAVKEQWLGKLFDFHSVIGNDVRRSNVPITRSAFRYEVYMEEVTYLQSRSAIEIPNRVMRTPLEEGLRTLDVVGLTREEVLALRWRGLPVEDAAVVGSAKEEGKASHAQSSISTTSTTVPTLPFATARL